MVPHCCNFSSFFYVFYEINRVMYGICRIDGVTNKDIVIKYIFGIWESIFLLLPLSLFSC